MSDRKVLMVRKRHSRDDVVREALALLDEAGIDAVTLRRVARRMGLHLNSVSFQVTSKARLFELMADAILGELSLDQLPPTPATGSGRSHSGFGARSSRTVTADGS
jgi:TetR/AcrR family tetracycline transcriptional repressor